MSQFSSSGLGPSRWPCPTHTSTIKYEFKIVFAWNKSDQPFRYDIQCQIVTRCIIKPSQFRVRSDWQHLKVTPISRNWKNFSRAWELKRFSAEIELPQPHATSQWISNDSRAGRAEITQNNYISIHHPKLSFLLYGPRSFYRNLCRLKYNFRVSGFLRKERRRKSLKGSLKSPSLEKHNFSLFSLLSIWTQAAKLFIHFLERFQMKREIYDIFREGRDCKWCWLRLEYSLCCSSCFMVISALACLRRIHWNLCAFEKIIRTV